MAKRIMCFGDSLTWGWTPVAHPGAATSRYDFSHRWPGQLGTLLGPDYDIVEEALNGRTTNIADTAQPTLNGAAYLPTALASHQPLDLVIVMLGSNDTKAQYRRSPVDIAAGAATLLKQIAASAAATGTNYPAPEALLIAPPPMHPSPYAWLAAQFADGPAKTGELPQLYEAVAEHVGAHFFDAGAVTNTSGKDGIHLTPGDNARLGSALAPIVMSLLR